MVASASPRVGRCVDVRSRGSTSRSRGARSTDGTGQDRARELAAAAARTPSARETLDHRAGAIGRRPGSPAAASSRREPPSPSGRRPQRRGVGRRAADPALARDARPSEDADSASRRAPPESRRRASQVPTADPGARRRVRHSCEARPSRLSDRAEHDAEPPSGSGEPRLVTVTAPGPSPPRRLARRGCRRERLPRPAAAVRSAALGRRARGARAARAAVTATAPQPRRPTVHRATGAAPPSRRAGARRRVAPSRREPQAADAAHGRRRAGGASRAGPCGATP